MTAVHSEHSALEFNSHLDGKEKNNVKSKSTNWRAVIIASILFFFTGLENTSVLASEWPYMKTIDPEATFSLFGLAISISNWGNAIFSILYSFWTYKFQTVRWPLLVGRFISFLGFLLYFFVEFFPKDKRFVMLACNFIFAMGRSSTAVLRVYLVASSSDADRSRAFALFSLATMTSIVVGPLVQFVFSGIPHPGLEIHPLIHFNLFSAPVWLATASTFLTWMLVFFALPEIPRNSCYSEDGIATVSSVHSMMLRLKKIRSLHVSWWLVGLVLISRLFMEFSLDTIPGITPAIFMTVFGWDHVQTVRWTSFGMGAVGLVSILVALSIASGFVSRWFSSRIQLIFAFALCLFMYTMTYPYSFMSMPVPEYNATTNAGCNSAEHSWCTSSRSPYPFFFIPIVLISVGLALPTVNISLDTIYSKVVGDANQSVMQGLVVFMDDVSAIISPLYTSIIFSAAGQSTLWVCQGAMSLIAVVTWTIAHRRIKDC